MQTLSATQPPLSSASQTTPAPAPQRGSGVLNSDFETFLKMLTTQMRNQDPLNPVESSDFAVQLATFSTVEQQVRTNDLLSDLGARITTLGLGQLSGWIGLEARALTPVSFHGQPVTLTASIDPLADAAQLVVTDAQGVVVQTQAIPPRSGRLDWTGLDPAGLPLPEGIYQISAQSFSQGEIIAERDVEVHGQITEARLEAGETVVVMENGEVIPASQILGLRPADT
jgi:flagellar basal-body rod modification protein FlgD